MISYLLKVTVFQLILLAVYHVGFKRYTFFQVNRFFLLFSVFISFLIPFISAPSSIQESPVMLPEIILTSGDISVENIIETASVNWYLDIVFVIGVALFSLLFIFRIYKLSKIIFSSPKKIKSSYTLVNLQLEDNVFSWFNYVFAHKNKLTEETLSHELVHIKQKHSFDILLLEIAQIILWFSPVIRWYKHELQLVHEYQADAKAVKKSISTYAQLLVNELFQVNELSLVHNFWNVSQIKSRIKMLNKMKTPKIKFVKYLLILPLLAIFTLEYSCTRDNNNSIEVEEKKGVIGEVFEFQKVDEQPEVIGIDNNLSREEKYLFFQKFIMKHVKDNFKYPEQAKKDSIQGRAIVQFIISKDGKVIGANGIHSSSNLLLDAEALRIVNIIPDMKPAYHDGKPVAVSFMLPITFKLK